MLLSMSLQDDAGSGEVCAVLQEEDALNHGTFLIPVGQWLGLRADSGVWDRNARWMEQILISVVLGHYLESCREDAENC